MLCPKSFRNKKGTVQRNTGFEVTKIPCNPTGCKPNMPLNRYEFFTIRYSRFTLNWNRRFFADRDETHTHVLRDFHGASCFR